MEQDAEHVGDGACFDDETLARLANGEWCVGAGSPTETHLALCPDCRALVAALVHHETRRPPA